MVNRYSMRWQRAISEDWSRWLDHRSLYIIASEVFHLWTSIEQRFAFLPCVTAAQ